MPKKQSDEPDDSELSELLEKALDDFDRLKNTDDEIDSLMEGLDKQAMQKAVGKFDKIICEMTTRLPKEECCAPNSASLTMDDKKTAENFQEMLKALVAAEEKLLEVHKTDNEKDEEDKARAEAFMKQMKDLSENDPSDMLDESKAEPLMSLMQSFFSKNLMYPCVKQLLNAFPGYLESHEEIVMETRALYGKQIDVLERICTEYEKEDDDDPVEAKKRFDNIATLMMELQTYGYPPEELVGETPAGWALDPVSGIALVTDVTKASDSCSLM